MTQEEINKYYATQQKILTEQQEVDSLNLSLKIAREELTRLSGLITRKKTELNLERYTNLQNELILSQDTISEEIETYTIQAEQLDSELAQLKSAAKNLNSQITSQRKKLTTQEIKLEQLEAEPPSESIQAEIAQVKSQIAILQASIAGLEQKKNDNLAEQKAVQNQLGNVTNLQQAAVQRLQIAKATVEEIGQTFATVQEELNVLYASRSAKEAGIAQLSENLTLHLDLLHNYQYEFSFVSDPRNLIQAINDDTPFLLLPVRVETRFMTVKHVKRVNHPSEAQGEVGMFPDKKELWVRIFPDDIATHSHETRLTQDEFEAGQTYWNAIWALDPADPETENIKLGAWRVLVSGYSSERSAWIVKQCEPTNLTITPLPAVAVFPTLVLKPAAWTEKPVSKVMPDRFVVRVYPNASTHREILGNTIPDPLPLGFDPSSTDIDNEFDQLDGVVSFPEDIQWLSDFAKAEAIGMGIKVQLQGDEAITGFDKILVLGLKLSINKQTSKNRLEELIDNHHYTDGGFSLLPQGTPTNNTEDAESGYASHEMGQEESYLTEVKGPLFTNQSNRFQKTDGQWFAEMLGISESKIQHIRYADRFDQQEEMAMNCALWPATMGYYMKQMLAPLVFSRAHNDIRAFYTDHITARGRIPSFRVKNQPYGVMVTSAFSDWKYPTVQTNRPLYTLKRMHENYLLPLNSEYNRLVDYVLHADSPGDKQENFLKILGLHASSVEFHQRFAGGQYFSWNLLQYFKNAPVSGSGEEILEMTGDVPEDLRAIVMASLGINMSVSPRILQMLFVQKERLLNGPVIDLDRLIPFSEVRGIQSFPDTTTNYIEWMLMSNFYRIRAENFDNIPGVHSDQKPPKALLYLLLRHGYLMEHVNAALEILQANKLVYAEAQVEFELHKSRSDESISVEEMSMLTKIVRSEMVLNYELRLEDRIQVMEQEGTVTPSNREQVKSSIRREEAPRLEQDISREFARRRTSYSVDQVKWNYLEMKPKQITGGKTMLEHILGTLSLNNPYTGYLAKIKESLQILKDMPTARLERCMAESLDICNYRLDAWLMGLVNMRAEEQLEAARASGTSGVFLGAFGMLENIRPNVSFPGISIIETNGSLSANPPNFVYLGTDFSTELTLDSDLNKVVPAPRFNEENLGFIHAPSMNHATAAAILRAGYGGHEGTASPDDALAINLRSDRVRKALFYIEGIRNGQELTSLLGYQFERALHDLDAGLDQYILDIRRVFPLVANSVVGDDPTEGSIEAFEARNVVNGLKLIEAYRANPSGWHTGTGVTNPTALAAINAEIVRITDHMDAVSDLMMAESMYQVATGNQERAGAVMKALGEGGLMPDPQIIRTPRLDKVFMQRMSVLFDTSTGNPAVWPGNASPRSYCEPALNSWMAAVLPNPADVIINYQYTTIDGNGDEVITDEQIALDELGLQPVDLVYMLSDQGNGEDGTQLSALINYIALHTVSFTEIPVVIRFIDRTALTPDQMTIFELLPLIRTMREMIGQGRPAKAEDFLIEGDVYNVVQAATPGQGMDLTNVEARLTTAFGPTTTGIVSLLDLKSALTDARDDVDNIAAIPGSEPLFDALRDLLLQANAFAIVGWVPEVAIEYSVEAQEKLSKQAGRVLAQIDSIQSVVSAAFADLAGITETEDRLEKLRDIGRALFGRNHKVFPEFNFYNKTDIDLSRSNADLLTEGGDFAIEEWLHGISKVRTKMSGYHLHGMLTESLSERTPNREVIQLPVVSNTDDRWLGCKLPAGYTLPDQAISLVLDLPDVYSTSNLQSGIILDEWTESVPDPTAITGLTFNYDQPNSEAPNTLLLAVTPEVTGTWSWEDLMNILDETLLMAKKRAIDPDIINQNSVLGHMLPAIVAAVEASDSAPGMDFSRNIVNAPSGQVGPINVNQYLSAQ